MPRVPNVSRAWTERGPDLREGRGAAPVPALATVDAVALILGIVIGAGIFRAPPAVAANSGSAVAMIAAWALGGLVSLAGAMCYAELACAYPSAGGDYHFLARALGRGVAFLFGWARLTVIPTGSLALLGFVFGDYAAQALGVPASASGLAAAMVIGVTLLNLGGLRPARGVQNALTAALVLGLVALISTGLLVAPAPQGAAPAAQPSFGLAMVFVLLTYGGWNEAAYVSAELRGGRRAIVTALAVAVGAVTLLYVLVNVAYLRGLGLAGMERSGAVASDLFSRGLGAWGGRAFALLVVAAVITSANGTLFMGRARCGRSAATLRCSRRSDAGTAAPARRRTRSSCRAPSRSPSWGSAQRPGAGSRRWWPTPRRCSGSSSSSPASRCSSSVAATPRHRGRSRCRSIH